MYLSPVNRLLLSSTLIEITWSTKNCTQGWGRRQLNFVAQVKGKPNLIGQKNAISKEKEGSRG